MNTAINEQDAIRQIQVCLLELHHSGANLPAIRVDGRYGEKTRAAVSLFQEQSSLPVTGKVDYETWTALHRAYRYVYDERSGKPCIPPDTAFPVRSGSRGEGVRLLQKMLNVLADRYRIGLHTDVNGIFTYTTAALVSAIEKIYALPKSGEVSAVLYAKLLRDYGYPDCIRYNEKPERAPAE